MENAVEALKMAGSVLLFVMALSIAMLSFTQARTAIDTLVKYSDREQYSIEENSRKKEDEIFYYVFDKTEKGDVKTERYVGMETIIPTVYRSMDESYKIIFDFPDNYFLYEEGATIGDKREIKTIDFNVDVEGLGNKLEFLNGIVYGKIPESRTFWPK